MADSDDLQDRLDRLVAEFSDRVQAGEPVDPEAWLEEVPAAQRGALRRCFAMVRAGLTPTAPGSMQTLGPGAELDGYRIERELGRGGMATVYLAEQQDLRRLVALKVLRPGLAIEPRNVDRFRREALAVARLTHPHIVQIHAVGEADGYHYFAMEYVEGRNLGEILAELPEDGPRTAAHLAAATGIATLGGERSFESAMAELLLPAVRAIAVAHELGLVHRDLKPSNILVHRDGRAMIADFGLAKGDGDPCLSMTGEPLGTPYYMSPEQAAMVGHGVDERSDIYSLGVTLFECLSGHRPYLGATAFEVLDAIRGGLPRQLRAVAPGCSRAAEAVVERAMAYRREDRYGSAIDLAADLAALAEGRQTQALAERGGAMRRALLALRRVGRGEGFEYMSSRRCLGLPLVHINYRRRRPGHPRIRVARGWLAMSDLAMGGLCFGPLAVGLVSLGSLGVGLLSLGGVALGGYSFGGVSGGVFATGGLAAGFGAAGGCSVGYYAFGGLAIGSHVIDGMTSTRVLADPFALAFFERFMPWVAAILPAA